MRSLFQGRTGCGGTLCIRRTLSRHVTNGTATVIFAVLTVFWLFLTVLTIGTLLVYQHVLVDMWRLVHQWSFLLFWLFCDCFWRLVHYWYSLGDMWPIVTPMDGHFRCFDCLLTVFDHYCTNSHRSTKTVPIVYQQCTNRQKSQKTVKTAKMTIGVPVVTCLPRLYQQCTNRQKQSKTVKRQ